MRRLAVFFLLIACSASGQPAITGVSGSVADGESFVVSGTGFGAAPNVIKWDNFESGTLLENISAPIIGTNWTFFKLAAGDVPLTHYSDQQAHSGDKSAKVTWTEPGYTSSTVNSFGFGGLALPSVYMSYWRYHDPSNTNIAGYNHKQVYYYGAANNLNQFIPYMVPAGNTYWASYLQNDPSGRWNYAGLTYASTCYNWGRWESWVDYNDVPGEATGEFDVWYNGELYGSYSGLNLANPANGNNANDIRIGHMFQYQTDPTPLDYCRSYFDDVYIATTRTRVEIGNAPIFDNCTVREIQVAGAWSATSATVDGHVSASFSAGSSAYVFVVDANGVSSAGYPVTIGGTSGAPSAPGRPQNVTATEID